MFDIKTRLIAVPKLIYTVAGHEIESPYIDRLYDELAHEPALGVIIEEDVAEWLLGLGVIKRNGYRPSRFDKGENWESFGRALREASPSEPDEYFK